VKVPLNVASRLLPYALLLFVGIAGWSMGSTLLLVIVVLGVVAIAIGTSVTGRFTPLAEQREEENRPLI
jgi:hypothetical protein